MLKSLDDRYTRFLTPAMYDALPPRPRCIFPPDCDYMIVHIHIYRYDAIFSVATGDVAGVGVELTTEETQGTEIGRVLVNTVVPESPAERRRAALTQPFPPHMPHPILPSMPQPISPTCNAPFCPTYHQNLPLQYGGSSFSSSRPILPHMSNLMSPQR